MNTAFLDKRQIVQIMRWHIPYKGLVLLGLDNEGGLWQGHVSYSYEDDSSRIGKVEWGRVETTVKAPDVKVAEDAPGD